MAHSFNLPVEYHQQDTNYYCGAACAQMVLHQLGSGHLLQDDLYNDNHSYSTAESGWASGPDGLEWTMNDRAPSQGFNLHEALSGDEISTTIAWSLQNSNTGAIALVYGWQHWITVIGYEADRQLNNSEDTAANISGFYINNPWPPTPGGNGIPPHSSSDGCGTGGRFGIANEHISYATWLKDYMTGVPSGHWNGMFLAVCAMSAGGADKGKGKEKMQHVASNPSGIIDELTAMNIAEKSLFQLKGLNVKGAGIMQVTQAKPKLVRRLDRENDFYYLVPMGMPGSGNVQTIISVDARQAEYKQSIDAGFTNSLLFRSFHDTELKDLLSAKSSTLDYLLKENQAVQEEPEMVWMPCLESFSPYWPFQLVKVGERTVYVRVDGEVFLELNTSLRGA
ncbi:hypothetical protein [Pseudoflavitalea rhizosphaerae]|uniref:hypothetical protein n=1 Tax=Pseudoflavitalea rhizosphaerae TaxID=1884793 RepID=UPI000F8D0B22|nr:hypothetical protein [Pseudoflavitalea rhizosphaerae]